MIDTGKTNDDDDVQTMFEQEEGTTALFLRGPAAVGDPRGGDDGPGGGGCQNSIGKETVATTNAGGRGSTKNSVGKTTLASRTARGASCPTKRRRPPALRRYTVKGQTGWGAGW